MTAKNTDNNDKPLARLLVVDDEQDIVYVLKHGLQSYGFLVDGFTNPEDALQSFKSNAEIYRLVLCDSEMPSLSGIQLAKKVKEINPNVKVLLLTGFEIIDKEASDISPSTTGIDGFVHKPIRIRDLTSEILSLIDETKGQGSLKGQY